MTISEWIALGGVVIGILGFAFGIVKEVTTKSKQVLAEQQKTSFAAGEQSEILRSIKTHISSIDGNQKESNSSIQKLSVDLGKIGESAKSAHHRLDDHETRIVKLEEKN